MTHARCRLTRLIRQGVQAGVSNTSIGMKEGANCSAARQQQHSYRPACIPTQLLARSRHKSNVVNLVMSHRRAIRDTEGAKQWKKQL